MPRYKEYNETRVVEKAMNEFWTNGYGATSVSVLTQKMRINKFTFYEGFESKEQLLLRTMKYYYTQYFIRVLDQLRSEKDIIGFFVKILEPRENGLCGCYILSITAEIGDSIPEAVKILKEYIASVEEVLSTIAADVSPKASGKEHEVKVRQLIALFTSVPLIRSIKSKQSCLEYVREILTLMGMNNLSVYA